MSPPRPKSRCRPSLHRLTALTLLFVAVEALRLQEGSSQGTTTPRYPNNESAHDKRTFEFNLKGGDGIFDEDFNGGYDSLQPLTTPSDGTTRIKDSNKRLQDLVREKIDAPHWKVPYHRMTPWIRNSASRVHVTPNSRLNSIHRIHVSDPGKIYSEKEILNVSQVRNSKTQYGNVHSFQEPPQSELTHRNIYQEKIPTKLFHDKYPSARVVRSIRGEVTSAEIEHSPSQNDPLLQSRNAASSFNRDARALGQNQLPWRSASPFARLILYQEDGDEEAPEEMQDGLDEQPQSRKAENRIASLTGPDPDNEMERLNWENDLRRKADSAEMTPDQFEKDPANENSKIEMKEQMLRGFEDGAHRGYLLPRGIVQDKLDKVLQNKHKNNQKLQFRPLKKMYLADEALKSAMMSQREDEQKEQPSLPSRSLHQRRAELGQHGDISGGTAQLENLELPTEQLLLNLINNSPSKQSNRKHNNNSIKNLQNHKITPANNKIQIHSVNGHEDSGQGAETDDHEAVMTNEADYNKRSGFGVATQRPDTRRVSPSVLGDSESLLNKIFQIVGDHPVPRNLGDFLSASTDLLENGIGAPEVENGNRGGFLDPRLIGSSGGWLLRFSKAVPEVLKEDLWVPQLGNWSRVVVPSSRGSTQGWDFWGQRPSLLQQTIGRDDTMKKRKDMCLFKICTMGRRRRSAPSMGWMITRRK